MPEEKEIEPQKTTKSKKRLIVVIIRWFFVAVLGVLLILGLFFHAPWKILTLLAIFLAALTVLPKRFRKYFWGSIGAIVIILVIWVFLPDDNEGWQPYTFDEEMAALNAKYAVPDEENAAVIYNQLPEIFDDSYAASVSEDCNLIGELRKAWSAEDYPECAEWLNNHQDIIELLLRTTQYEQCYFGTKADVIMDESLFKPLSAARRAAQLLAFVANYDIGQGKLDECLAKYKAMIHIGEHFQQNPDTIHKLVGMAIDALAIGGLKRFIIEQNITDKQIEQTEEIISKAECSWNSHFADIIEYEKLFFKNSMAYYYEINSQDKVRFARDPWQRWRGHYKKILETDSLEHKDLKEHYESIAYPSYWQKKRLKANTLLLWLAFPSEPQVACEIIDDEYQSYYDMLKPDYDWQQSPKGLRHFLNWPTFTSMQLNFRYFAKTKVEMSAKLYHKLHELYMRFGADKRGTLLLAALKRYKDKNSSWPDNLSWIEELTAKENFTDPRSNGPFIYKTTKEGFLLYSIGANKIDEKGDRREPADDWPIWPSSGDSIWKKMRQDVNDTAEQNHHIQTK